MSLLSRRADSVLTCMVVSLVLNACVHYFLSPYRSDPWFVAYALAGRLCVCVVWVRLHQWLTGEDGVDPLANISITLLAPYLAEFSWTS